MASLNTEELSLEIGEGDYQGDIHSSLPQAIYRQLEEGDEQYQDIFGIEDLNRCLTEGSETGSGWEVEDFAISSSLYDGEIIVGQCVTGRGKEDNYERKQVMNLKYTLMNFHPETYERLNGSYVIAVDNSIEDAQEIEQEVYEKIEETGSAEIDIIVREIEEVPPSLGDLTGSLWPEVI